LCLKLQSQTGSLPHKTFPSPVLYQIPVCNPFCGRCGCVKLSSYCRYYICTVCKLSLYALSLQFGHITITRALYLYVNTHTNTIMYCNSTLLLFLQTFSFWSLFSTTLCFGLKRNPVKVQLVQTAARYTRRQKFIHINDDNSEEESNTF